VAEGNAQAGVAARKALELEPDLVEGHLAICWLQLMHDWDWQDAARAIGRALELAPGNADVLSAASMLAYNLGQLQEALVYGEHAVKVDPLNPKSYTHLGRALAALEMFHDEELAHRAALELSPDGVPFRLRLALSLEKQGKHDEAIAVAREERSDWGRLTALAILQSLGGKLPEADKALDALIATCADTAAVQVGMVYAVRNDADKAFEWLERAYRQRDSGLGLMRSMWVFRSLHGDPRWHAFLVKMGLAG
jgi:tetratricopeptide (TPR) repeat protein